ncbi:phenylacetate-CoA ligase [Symbiobacterium terraclitae]|uniref:Phenylacetate-CoA ligase n=1 Tax=Symbiobacterium terraclitae TaxID=557451 RepID=A0ABS4JTJ9_9FIRM|nr:hypothetical protein [Symbiobacterium terraclitae]MBP2018853.1 phenylacetate-CoA ligase [Symbiobacterium terraclitae]
MQIAVDRPHWRPTIERIPRAELAQMQAGRLRAQVARALASPFYRRLWQGAGPLDPADFRTPADVARLPFLHKSDLVNAQLREPPLGDLPMSPAEERREVYPVHVVGGSLYTVYGEPDLARTAEIGARIMWGVGLRPGELIHNAFGYGLFAGGISWHRASRAMGAALIPIGTDSVKRQVEMLFNFKPSLLIGAPSHCLYLAERIQERGLSPRDIGLRFGLFGGEPGAGEPATRRRLEHLYGCPAFDFYGITEVGPLLAGECRLQQGLHWAEDHVLVEVINPATLQPCAEGETGVLVLTDLTREDMPLIRYWTGDMASLVTEPCGCGRTLARSPGGVRGRIDELVMIRGVKFYPVQVERVLGGYGSLAEEYRIVLERDPVTWLDRCTVLVEAAPGEPPSPALEERIGRRLSDELAVDVLVRILPFGTLERSPRRVRIIDRRLEAGNP